MISPLITLVILCLIFGLIWTYLIPAIPDSPFKKVAIVLIVIIMIVVLVSFIPGVPFNHWGWKY